MASAGEAAGGAARAALGADVGTQGLKVLLWDLSEGKVLARASRSYGLLPSDAEGRAEQDPETWLQALQEAVREVLSAPAAQGVSVLGVGISGQQHGMVALDAEGRVVRPAKLWCDTESAAEARELSEAFGLEMPPGFTATKLLWLKRHEPEAFAKMATLLLPHDFVNFTLCGRLGMERGDASGTGLVDASGCAWDAERVARVDQDLARRLPPLVPPDAPFGRVTAAAAARFGLPEGAAVAPGSGDNMMAALGAGAVREGTFVVSLGTSATLFAYSKRPVQDPSGAVAPFCDATGGWLPLLCTMSCTGVLEEVRSAFSLSHEALEDLARSETPGSAGVNFLPYLQGERTPNWPRASGALLGLRPGCLRPGLVYRAALEGTTFALLAGYRRMQELGLRADELRVVGGGSKNALWRQIIADAFQLPVRPLAEPESAALGAALAAAAVATGRAVGEYAAEWPPQLAGDAVQPDAAAAAAYAAAFERHQKLGKNLFDATP